MFLALSLYVVLQRYSISGHINLNPGVSATTANVPLHVWSHGSMFICPKCAGKGWMWELTLAWRWLMVGITKNAITLTHKHTVWVFFQRPWLLLIAAVYPHGGECILIRSLSPCYAILHSGDSSHYRIRGSISEDELSSRRRNQLCNDCPHRGWNHLLPQCTADVISLYSGELLSLVEC